MGPQCHIIGLTAWKSHPGHNGWGPSHRPHARHRARRDRERPQGLPRSICAPPITTWTTSTRPSRRPTSSRARHKSGRALNGEKDPEWKGNRMQPVLCKAGDVLFFRSEVWHTGSENTSDRIRYLVQVHYSHRTIAQRFSPWPFAFNQELPRHGRTNGNSGSSASTPRELTASSPPRRLGPCLRRTRGRGLGILPPHNARLRIP